MAFINRVCDKVFVINMEKDKEKLAKIDKVMKDNRIVYERFNAVNGSKVIRDHRLSEYCNTFCTDGMKGCALSHRTIWDIMIEHGYKNVLVFEDDVHIDKTFDNKFQNVWNHLPKDYDIIYYGCIFGCIEESTANNVFKKIHGYENEDVNEFVSTTKGSVGTHAVMYSLEGAKKFASKEITFHIDYELLKWIKTYNYNAYTTSTNMVETDSEDSGLSDKYPNLLNSFFNKFQLNNHANPTKLNWFISENFLKLGPFNVNFLIVLLVLLVVLLPVKYYMYVGLWLLVELIVSGDFKNTFRYIILLGIPISLKYIIRNSNKS